MVKTVRIDEYETDNRGLNETVIVLKNGTRIDVSPPDLMRNALENLPEEMVEETLQAFEQFLTNIRYDG